MKTLSDEWGEFAGKALPEDAGPVQRRDMRRAFYSGAVVMFLRMKEAAAEDGEDAEDPCSPRLTAIEADVERISRFLMDEVRAEIGRTRREEDEGPLARRMAVFEFTGPSDVAEAWQRKALYDSEEGTCFLPADVAGEERAIALLAGLAGEAAFEHEGHVYVPSRWLELHLLKAGQAAMADAVARARETMTARWEERRTGKGPVP